MKDGTVGWNPGSGIRIHPAHRRVDLQVNVVYAETIGQKPLGPADRRATDGSRHAEK